MQGAEKGAQRRTLAAFHRTISSLVITGTALQSIAYCRDDTLVVKLVEQVHPQQLMLTNSQNRQAHLVAINHSPTLIEMQHTQGGMTKDGAVACLADT